MINLSKIERYNKIQGERCFHMFFQHNRTNLAKVLIIGKMQEVLSKEHNLLAISTNYKQCLKVLSLKVPANSLYINLMEVNNGK